ncbi:MAG TPA: hypothetical protein VF765_34350 [Polyangiaceae bacterium]
MPSGLARQCMAALVGLALAFALAASLARPAGRYFYCEAMGLLPQDPCRAAPAASDGRSTPEGRLDPTRYDCCEVFTLRALPAGATNPSPNVPPATVIAVLPAVAATDAADERLAHHVRATGRAPPRPPDKQRVHAHNQVFLT